MIGTAFSWVIFIGAAAVSLFSALMMITRRNPIHSALWLIVTFFSIAVIYLTLNAQFIAVAQVVVYAGAIMMLIVFVIMLIYLEKEMDQARKLSSGKAIAVFVTLLLFLEMGAVFMSYKMAGQFGASDHAMGQASDVKAVGSLLYGQYLFPFEIASILLLVGIIGAVILAKRSGEMEKR
jgi:NADH-quinone oxidoreductase subunit J